MNITIPLIKKRKAKIALTVLFMSVISMATAVAQNVTINPNGSFELSEVTISGDTTSVEGWNFFVQDGAGGSYAIVDSVSKDGSKSLAIKIDSTGTEEWSLGAVNEPFRITPGTTYNVKLWAKASEAGGTANFTIGLPAPNYTELGRIGSGDVSLSTEWQEFSLNFLAPAGSDTARAPFHFSFAANVGKTIYIDSVRITGPRSPVMSPIIVEAESGTLGAQIKDSTQGGVTFITTTQNNPEFIPGTPDRVATYEVTFPKFGAYDLYARVRAGSGTFDDDSFFYGAGFGEQNPDSASNWILANGMAAAGFSNAGDLVRAAGGAGSEAWKWVNLSRNGYGADPVSFFISEEDSLTQTFQLGTREDGLSIDKFAFGDTLVYFTVENLNEGTEGSLTDPTIPTETFEPIAQGKVKFLGNIYSGAQISRFDEYWNQVTPENAGKWGSVEGTRDQMNWGGLDDAYNLAKDNGFPFRFHVLVWGGQQPGWINDLSSEEQLEEITEWFEAVAERYPDIDYLEVVNEGSNGHQLPDGISGQANYIDALGGTGETGHDWIITAFQMARDIFGNDVKLMINDYGIVGNITATNNYINIINDLKDRGLIDAIGVQSHAFSTTAASADIKRTLDMLARTDRPIQATEFDLDGNDTDGDPNTTTDASDQAQLQRYQRVFPLFWEHPGVMGVTLWGWRPGLWRNDQEAYLISSSNVERPALEWLRAYVDTAQVTLDVSIEDEEVALAPGDYKLDQNYPNPFNPSTKISFTLPSSQTVTLKVYDMLGREVATLVNNEAMSSGSHTMNFDASSLSSGIYIYTLSGNGVSLTKRMTLIK